MATPIEITRRLAATPVVLNALEDACGHCWADLPSPDTGDLRPLDELLATPDWHRNGCPWAEAVLWDAYHPETQEAPSP